VCYLHADANAGRSQKSLDILFRLQRMEKNPVMLCSGMVDVLLSAVLAVCFVF
jgi:hypothetical protein